MYSDKDLKNERSAGLFFGILIGIVIAMAFWIRGIIGISILLLLLLAIVFRQKLSKFIEWSNKNERGEKMTLIITVMVLLYLLLKYFL